MRLSRKKKTKKNEQILRGMQHTTKYQHMHNGCPTRRGEKETERISEGIIVQNSPNLMEVIQEAT